MSDSKNSSIKEEGEKELYPRPHIYDGDYFEVVNRERDMLTVQ